jgi:cytochrome c oxidase subunit 2
MEKWVPFIPEKASTVAGSVDALYFFLVGVSVFFALLIAGLELYFAIRYRRRSQGEMPVPVHGSMKLEMLWIVIPFLISMVMFAWGSSLYFTIYRPPKDALDIYVVGKQWMWKLQHLDGKREINELHVPVGRKVKLTMTSEDVIHSFFVPAFRIKADVLPGRYTTVWFEATKPGRYHLFCAEYCGTSHSGMGGWVTVMEPADYQGWLSGSAGEGSLASTGEKLFQDLACVSCHRTDIHGRGPALKGLFNRPVQLEGGQTVIADEGYIRESILNPRAKLVAGFPPIMPTFQGQITEEQLLQLLTYIKSIGPEETPAAPPSPGAQVPSGGAGVTGRENVKR